MAEEAKRTNKLEEELRSLFGQVESIRQQIESVDATILDLATVLETLDYIKTRGSDKVVLVPIGAGNFIRAKIIDTEHVIMGVGGRLSIEASVDDAKELINQRIKSLESLRLDLRRKLEEINAKIREMLEKSEQQAQQ